MWLIPCESLVLNNNVQWSADLKLCCWPSTEMVGSTEERGALWSSIRNNKPLHFWAVAVSTAWCGEVNLRVEAAVRIHLIYFWTTRCAEAGDTEREVKDSMQNVRPFLCVCSFAKTNLVLEKSVSFQCWRNTSSLATAVTGGSSCSRFLTR